MRTAARGTATMTDQPTPGGPSTAARPAPSARPTTAAKQRPDPRPMRLGLGAGAIAAMSIMAAGLIRFPVADADRRCRGRAARPAARRGEGARREARPLCAAQARPAGPQGRQGHRRGGTHAPRRRADGPRPGSGRPGQEGEDAPVRSGLRDAVDACTTGRCAAIRDRRTVGAGPRDAGDGRTADAPRRSWAGARRTPRTMRLGRVARRVHAWAARLTRFTATSDLAALNADPSRPMTPVRPTLAAVLDWAERAGDRAEGHLAVSLLDERLAAEGAERAGSEGEADADLHPHRWWLERRPRGAIVRRDGAMRFDLDGVAKGWIADRALELLRRWPAAMVDADGDIAMRLAPGVAWHIGGRRPAPGRGRGPRHAAVRRPHWRRGRVARRDVRHERPPLAGGTPAAGRATTSSIHARGGPRDDRRGPGDGHRSHCARGGGARQGGAHRRLGRGLELLDRSGARVPCCLLVVGRDSRPAAHPGVARMKYQGSRSPHAVAALGACSSSPSRPSCWPPAAGRSRRSGRGSPWSTTAALVRDAAARAAGYLAITGSVVYGLLLSTGILDVIAQRTVTVHAPPGPLGHRPGPRHGPRRGPDDRHQRSLHPGGGAWCRSAGPYRPIWVGRRPARARTSPRSSWRSFYAPQAHRPEALADAPLRHVPRVPRCHRPRAHGGHRHGGALGLLDATSPPRRSWCSSWPTGSCSRWPAVWPRPRPCPRPVSRAP